ncbi:hypothetical protein TNCV_1752891 [Trichonephila clavipes]|nr:hypothetical protein TNCV_1752891 [Trichonephila clavipes]
MSNATEKSNLNNASTREARRKRIKRAHQLAEQIESRNLAQKESVQQKVMHKNLKNSVTNAFGQMPPKNLTSTTRAAKGRDAKTCWKRAQQLPEQIETRNAAQRIRTQKVVHENLKNSVTNVCNRILREQEWHENET